jgi:hypothetical protein
MAGNRRGLLGASPQSPQTGENARHPPENPMRAPENPREPMPPSEWVPLERVVQDFPRRSPLEREGNPAHKKGHTPPDKEYTPSHKIFASSLPGLPSRPSLATPRVVTRDHSGGLPQPVQCPAQETEDVRVHTHNNVRQSRFLPGSPPLIHRFFASHCRAPIIHCRWILDLLP